MRIVTLLILVSITGCSSNYVPKDGQATATLKLYKPDRGITEMFTYDETCDTISMDSEPFRLAGAGPSSSVESFPIEANRRLLIGASFTDTIYTQGACVAAYELSFEEGGTYEVRARLREVKR